MWPSRFVGGQSLRRALQVKPGVGRAIVAPPAVARMPSRIPLSDHGASAIVGMGLGVAVDITSSVGTLKLWMFWGGLMWPLVALALIAAWLAIHQRCVGSSLAMTCGAVLALFPAAYHDSLGSPSYELWFPLVMIGLVATCFAPLFVALRSGPHKQQA